MSSLRRQGLKIYGLKKIIIIGGGIGGLTASVYLKKHGFDVLILEASDKLGGLARSDEFDGMEFDAGPYILLDKPGLEWSFTKLEIPFEENIKPHLINNIYEVNEKIRFDKSLAETVTNFNSLWNGQGDQYKKFVESTGEIYKKLNPYTYISHPTPWHLLKKIDIKLIAFMISSLNGVLNKYNLNDELKNAIGIWTNVASQSLTAAPSPMAFVPSLFHGVGSYYPMNGIGSIAKTLDDVTINAGVNIVKNQTVKKIMSKNGVVSGVLLSDGKTEDADIVLCNMSAVSVYTNLLDNVPGQYQQYLQSLPLQSPGLCVYLKIKTKQDSTYPYLQFKLEKNIPTTVAFVNPGFLFEQRDSYNQARIVAPLPHHIAEKMSKNDEIAIIEKLLTQAWWKKGILDYEVLHRRTSKDWGSDFNLYRNSMNPVMTASFMRKGRMPHKSKYYKGLYFCGSSTHPGQWISFCSISGILASQKIMDDYA